MKPLYILTLILVASMGAMGQRKRDNVLDSLENDSNKHSTGYYKENGNSVFRNDTNMTQLLYNKSQYSGGYIINVVKLAGGKLSIYEADITEGSLTALDTTYYVANNIVYQTIRDKVQQAIDKKWMLITTCFKYNGSYFDFYSVWVEPYIAPISNTGITLTPQWYFVPAINTLNKP